ncbi:lamin tail domain-containing protein [uncultured Thermanaerothrix sp.]|uniref:lamin tail domain-containing protein n=1 Tax=uncultured Thermanaerothrix sp. TaxID=1195149 RepID=UPI00262A178B|nr:lamin tail domain-containing protein [uncultured Thermanaerothrix sp.]
MLKRLLPYILLNVLVSALTTLVVLTLWDRAQRPAPLGQNLPTWAPAPPEATLEIQSPSALLVSPTPTLPTLDQAWITIAEVLAPGDLQHEAVLLKRLGDGDLWLMGWRLLTPRGQSFEFPNLTLSKNGSIRIYTRRGNNTVIELYWGLETAAWRRGDKVRLLDPEGNLRAEYIIP